MKYINQLTINFISETLRNHNKRFLSEIFDMKQVKHLRDKPFDVEAMDRERINKVNLKTKAEVLNKMKDKLGLSPEQLEQSKSYDDPYTGKQVDVTKTGAYGYGVPDEDPFRITKQTHVPTEKLNTDPYFIYVKLCAKYAKSNPYFPRVELLSIDTDENGMKLPNYKIEKLISYQNLGVDVLLGAARKINPTLEREIIQTYGQDWRIHKVSLAARKQIIIREIGNYLKSIAEDEMYEDGEKVAGSPDRRVYQCMKLIADIVDAVPNFDYDLHSDNIMFRLSPQGVQPVLTDPIKVKSTEYSSDDN